MLAALDEMIYGRLLAAVALAILALQAVVTLIAARRRARIPAPLALHAAAGVAILALPVLVAISVHAARALTLAAFTMTYPSDKAEALSAGLAGQLNAIPFGVTATGLAVALWVVGFGLTRGAAQRDGAPAPAFPPVVVLAAALVPIWYGTLMWAANLIHALARTDVAPDEKAPNIMRTLETARAQLELCALVSALLIPILAVIAAVLILRRPSAPARRRTPALAAAALASAALLWVAARPFAAENRIPWPPPLLGDQLRVSDPPTPDLVGPDTIERAPVVMVSRERLGLDGTKGEDFESLESKLVTLRNNYRLLNPGADFNGIAVIIADPATPIPRLVSVLQAVRGADYHNPMFVFTKDETIRRPVFGDIHRYRSTGARVRVAYPDGVDSFEYDDEAQAAEWKKATPLRPQDFADYGAFARKLVELRRADKPIIVTVDRPAR